MSEPARKPRALRIVPNKTAVALVTNDAPALAPTRPVLLESATFRAEMTLRLDDVSGEIALLDAAEAKAESDFAALIAHETDRRNSTRAAQAHRRADLMQVHDGCAAALDASVAKDGETI